MSDPKPKNGANTQVTQIDNVPKDAEEPPPRPQLSFRSNDEEILREVVSHHNGYVSLDQRFPRPTLH